MNRFIPNGFRRMFESFSQHTRNIRKFYHYQRILLMRRGPLLANNLRNVPIQLVYSIPLLSISIYDAFNSRCHANDELYSGKQLIEALHSRIPSIRSKLQKEKKSYHHLHVNSVNDYDVVSLDINSLGLDSTLLLLRWLTIVFGEQATSDHSMNPAHSKYSITTRFLYDNVLVQRVDKSAAIVVDHDNGFRVQLFKKGFTSQEIDTILDGYYQFFSQRQALLFSNTDTQDPISKMLKLFQQFGLDLMMDMNDEDDLNMIPSSNPNAQLIKPSKSDPSSDIIQQLQKLGVEVFDRQQNEAVTWDSLAGYDDVKQHIEETVVNAYKYPDIYDNITKQTRVFFESNRPKAILLEGPPGTGKTLTARILANRCDKPFVHIKMDSIVSKWYGESEQKLAKVFDLCDALDGAIIFIDEVDTIASSRDDSTVHEATRHLLSIILQRIEGFHGKGKSLLVCATNRKHALDAALISRFDLSIHYHLPDYNTRIAVYKLYAKQLTGDDTALHQLASLSDGLSCRDMKETCEHTERRWANRKVMNDKSMKGELPAIRDYIDAIQHRKISVYNHHIDSVSA